MYYVLTVISVGAAIHCAQRWAGGTRERSELVIIQVMFSPCGDVAMLQRLATLAPNPAQPIFGRNELLRLPFHVTSFDSQNTSGQSCELLDDTISVLKDIPVE